MKENEDTQKIIDRISKIYEDIPKSITPFEDLLWDKLLQQVFWICYMISKDNDTKKIYTYEHIRRFLKISVSTYQIRKNLNILQEYGFIRQTSKGSGSPYGFLIINLKGYVKFLPILEEMWGSKINEKKTEV